MPFSKFPTRTRLLTATALAATAAGAGAVVPTQSSAAGAPLLIRAQAIDNRCPELFGGALDQSIRLETKGDVKSASYTLSGHTWSFDPLTRSRNGTTSWWGAPKDPQGNLRWRLRPGSRITLRIALTGSGAFGRTTRLTRTVRVKRTHVCVG